MKRIALAIILIISLIIINNLVRSIYNLWQKQDLVVKTEQDLKREKELSMQLAKQYEAVRRKDFVEKEARNKLFFVKPGEEMIILPQDPGQKAAAVPVKRRKRELTPSEEWLSLFALPTGD